MLAMLSQPQEPFGQRLLVSMIDSRATKEPNAPWVSIPKNDNDVTLGYKDVSYSQLSNAVNRAAAWLKASLPPANNSFLPFAYAGAHDLRYPILAIAAAKLGYVILLPSTFITAAAQLRIMNQKDCTILLHASTLAAAVSEVVALDPRIQAIAVPDLDYFLSNERASPIPYNKTWEEAKDDPWLVFNTSGSTGFAKAITYTQAMLSFPDFLLGLGDSIKQTNIHLTANTRCLVALPLLHYVGMVWILSMTVYLNTVIILQPPGKSVTPTLISGILQNATIDAAVLLPRNLDALVSDPVTLKLLRSLRCISYAGAVLSPQVGNLLSPYTRVFPAVGSTDAGMYFVELHNVEKDWDFVTFQPHAGIAMEHRHDNMYELVFIRTPGAIQPVFGAFPHLDKFYTSDLWTEHPDPNKKGQWKIVGRTDDLLKLADGATLHATSLEAMIQEHPLVRSVLVGGEGKSSPVILVEPTEEIHASLEHDVNVRDEFWTSLRPYIEKANTQNKSSVQLDPSLAILTQKDKLFPRTMKETVARAHALRLYDKEIEAMCGSSATRLQANTLR